MPLSDAKIRNAKLKEAGKTTKLSDGGGLQLWITPAGGKYWSLAYRFEGKQKRLSIGAYPAISLIEAREARTDAKGLLAHGIDPSQQKHVQTELETNKITFRAASEDFLNEKRQAKRSAATMAKLNWLLGFAIESFGETALDKVKPGEIRSLLDSLRGRGRFETAKRLRAVIAEVFALAIENEKTLSNPTPASRARKDAPPVKHRAAITDQKRFGELLRAIDGYSGQPETRIALQLLALTFVRPGEARLAEWCQFDLEKAIWTIPQANTKMRREHQAPLARQTLRLLKELQKLSGHGKLLFPSIRSKDRPISENSLNAALRRLDYGQEEMSAHGFRATASTLLNESGEFNPDAIEAALAHVVEGGVRKAYLRGAFWPERVRMAQWWADELDRLRSSK